MSRRAFRAELLHFTADPRRDPAALRHHADGLLVVEGGRIAAAGDAAALMPTLPPGTPVEDLRGRLIIPGMVDTHLHFAQADIIASHGEEVLEWLTRYTFPAEGRFADPAHAREVADFSLDEMLRNGTTTGMMYATVHPGSVDAVFAAAEARGMALIAGKVLMDRNCPPYLADTADRGYADSKALIGRWHGQGGGRLRYAVTPRFAPTSTDRQLELAGRLLDEHPGVYLQTHLCENENECRWVRELFPWSTGYLDVYDHFGLVRERSVFGHCIYLDDRERARMAAAGAAMAFCPTSNLFLGSGLFDLDAARRADVRVGLGTDVGGGTSFSLLATLAEAYKVLRLKGQDLDVRAGLYLATLGGAEALYLDDEIGNFQPGKFADFVVLDPAATPLAARRWSRAESLDDRLFALMMLGNEAHVAATYVQGRAAFRRA